MRCILELSIFIYRTQWTCSSGTSVPHPRHLVFTKFSSSWPQSGRTLRTRTVPPTGAYSLRHISHTSAKLWRRSTRVSTAIYMRLASAAISVQVSTRRSRGGFLTTRPCRTLLMVHCICLACSQLICINTVTMHDAPPSIPQSNTTPVQPPPPARPVRASKGKGREIPLSTLELPHTPPYTLRGTKRRADANPSTADVPVEPTAIPKGEEVTPHQSVEVPLVHVDDGSPPPARRARTENSVAVSTGDVCLISIISCNICSYSIQNMCGPCQKLSKAECRSQGGRCLTTACQSCSEGKRPCSIPSPSWAMPVLDALNMRGMCLLAIHHSLLTHLWKLRQTLRSVV
jgi:hypothetical protein